MIVKEFKEKFIADEYWEHVLIRILPFNNDRNTAHIWEWREERLYLFNLLLHIWILLPTEGFPFKQAFST